MSLESFFGLEEGESQGSAEAAEKFREQARQNARAIKAMTGHQQKQKKKEDKLAKILVRFIQDSSKGDIVFLVIKLLQENVPGAFILAILSIASAELEAELKEHFEEERRERAKELAAGKEHAHGHGHKHEQGHGHGHEELAEGANAPEAVTQPATASALIHFSDDKLPEEVRDELNAWGEAILEAGLMMPGKTLETVLTPAQKLKSLVLDLIDYSLEEYFSRHGLDLSKERIRQFALLSIQSVLIKLREISRSKTDAEIIETPLTSDNDAMH